MTIDINDIARQWLSDHPRYDEFTVALIADIEHRLRSAGIKPIKVSGRSKDPATLITKMIRKGYERYDEVTDKSGVRVVVRMDSEVEHVVQLLCEAYRCDVDDKRASNDVGLFGYRAVHLQAMEPIADFAGMDSEIQVRTICADAWSEMSHFLAYKSPIRIPDEVDRTQRALAGLFELADREYERQFATLSSLPERRGAALLEMILPVRLRLSGAPWDQELSVTMLTALAGAYGGLGDREIADAVDSWVQVREVELRDLLEQARDYPDTKSPLLLQPESLLVGERLSARADELVDVWCQAAPHSALEAIAFGLGLSLPPAISQES